MQEKFRPKISAGQTGRTYAHLVFVDVVRELRFAELVEGDDDERDEDVDEEEGEDDEVDDVEDGRLRAEPRDRTLVLVSRGHRVLQDAGIQGRVRFHILNLNFMKKNILSCFYSKCILIS